MTIYMALHTHTIREKKYNVAQLRIYNLGEIEARKLNPMNMIWFQFFFSIREIKSPNWIKIICIIFSS